MPVILIYFIGAYIYSQTEFFCLKIPSMDKILKEFYVSVVIYEWNYRVRSTKYFPILDSIYLFIYFG